MTILRSYEDRTLVFYSLMLKISPIPDQKSHRSLSPRRNRTKQRSKLIHILEIYLVPCLEKQLYTLRTVLQSNIPSSFSLTSALNTPSCVMQGRSPLAIN